MGDMDQWHLHSQPSMKTSTHGEAGGPPTTLKTKVHKFQPATGAPIMTQEGVKGAHLRALLIKPVVKFEHSRLWSF